MSHYIQLPESRAVFPLACKFYLMPTGINAYKLFIEGSPVVLDIDGGDADALKSQLEFVKLPEAKFAATGKPALVVS